MISAMFPERTNAVFRDKFSRDVMNAIFSIHFPSCTIADMTWGKGAFWEEPLRSWVVARMDLNARAGAFFADSRFSPLKAGSVDVVVFDPPHLHGGISKTGTASLVGDFGSLKNQAEGHQLIIETTPEMRRVARRGAVIKVTDMVEGGRFMPTHSLVTVGCSRILGWPCDLAILDSGIVRPLRPGANVFHLRQAHSYFLVYKWTDNRKPRSPFCD